MSKLFALFILSLLAGAACTPTRQNPPIKQPVVELKPSAPKLGAPVSVKADSSVAIYPTDFASLTGWESDSHASAYRAFRRSCDSWKAQPDSRPLSGIFNLGTLGDWKKLCLLPVNNGAERQFFEKWFQPYAIASNGGFDGLYTGYFLPELHGSFQQSARYHVPVYGVPRDLVVQGSQSGRKVNGKLTAYYNRAEIVAGALQNKGAEILWVDNEIDEFFMEIQGSGQIVMDDGSIQSVGYAAKNGQNYVAVGKILVDRGEIPKEQISMQSIRAWMDSHPDQARPLMLQNPSVVFFKLNNDKAADGPKGSMNAPLTAGYSLAVDTHYFPLGIPLWLDADHPFGNQRIQRLVMAQDTGSAIKGLIRGDVYWGQGNVAANLAGLMKSRGRVFVLIPKGLPT